MKLPFEIFISLRYLLGKRKEAFISLISLISPAGVVVGVMALIVVLAVMNGFNTELKNKILGAKAHIYVEGQNGIYEYPDLIGKLKGYPHVVAIAPYVRGEAVLRYQDQIAGVLVKGIDYARELETTSLGSYLKEGEIPQGGPKWILIGSELRRRLNVETGEMLTLVSPHFTLTPLGTIPQLSRFHLQAVFKSGMYDYDSQLAYLELKEAQRLFGFTDRITGLALKLDNLDKAGQISENLRRDLGFSYIVTSWLEVNRSLFSALKLEKKVMFIILTLIVIVAAFNIISTLIMITMEKTRDIGILRSLGASRKTILTIFILMGLTIGLVGTGLGCFGGYVLAVSLEKYQFIRLPEVYYDVYSIEYLPVKMEGWDFLRIAASAFLISLLATIYPAWHASRLNMIEAIRYE